MVLLYVYMVADEVEKLCWQECNSIFNTQLAYNFNCVLFPTITTHSDSGSLPNDTWDDMHDLLSAQDSSSFPCHGQIGDSVQHILKITTFSTELQIYHLYECPCIPPCSTPSTKDSNCHLPSILTTTLWLTSSPNKSHNL